LIFELGASKIGAFYGGGIMTYMRSEVSVAVDIHTVVFLFKAPSSVVKGS
jgi:hypothetical protein